MATYDLGPMAGGIFHQYANAVGQVYYLDHNPNDTWTRDPLKSWPQWNNTRTGRATLIDPNPPPPQTYLDDVNVRAALDLLVRVPDSPEHVYRRPMGGILRFIFPASEGFDVVQETEGDNSRPDFCTFKVSRKPGGTFYQYEFMLIESKKAGRAWGDTEDQLLDHLSGNGNDSKNCYGMIQVGLEVQYYKYEGRGRVFSAVGGRMHLITDAPNVIAWGGHIKNNPMPFV